jgi:transcriptional regulator
VYVPRPNAFDDDAGIRAFVAHVASGELVTAGPDGYPLATLLPIMWHGDRVIAHMARPNPHWSSIAPGTPALYIVAGGQAYISPAWYEAKREHGRVVPTWNYESVHISGRVTVHDDAGWVRDAVTMLTDTHEQHRVEPWAVTDAPAEFIDGQLRGIVGIEFEVERVEGKAKLSQNRSDADREGAIEGLQASGNDRDRAMEQRMRNALG